MRVVICGGGVIGASIAYFLSLKGIEAVVVERAGVACAASGKSGGFLALDWCDGSALEPLARRSFALHAELAATIAGDWGYRRLDTLGVVASERRDIGAFGRGVTPDWLSSVAAVHGQLGTVESTAQVHPAEFTQAMMTAAIANGARLRIGTVDGIGLSPDGSRVTGAIVDGAVVAGDAVVIAMGPWSILAGQWLPLPAVHGLKGHSLVFEGEPSMSPQALFVEYEAADGEVSAPEVFPRPDGTTYVCGVSGEATLPVDPTEVGPEPGGCEKLQAMVTYFAPALGQAKVLAAQACYRPITSDGLPLLGPVPDIAGAYVATGHSVWGILNGPASGEAMAELIGEGSATTVDIAAFDPARLPTLKADEVRVQSR